MASNTKKHAVIAAPFELDIKQAISGGMNLHPSPFPFGSFFCRKAQVMMSFSRQCQCNKRLQH
jgi:hypothetical protein